MNGSIWRLSWLTSKSKRTGSGIGAGFPSNFPLSSHSSECIEYDKQLGAEPWFLKRFRA